MQHPLVVPSRRIQFELEWYRTCMHMDVLYYSELCHICLVVFGRARPGQAVGGREKCDAIPLALNPIHLSS